MLKFILAVKPQGNITYGRLKKIVLLEIFTEFEKTLKRLFKNQRRQYFMINRICKKYPKAAEMYIVLHE